VNWAALACKWPRWPLAASGKPSPVLLATKVGKDMGGDHTGLSRRWIRQAVEDSLRRLQTDRIDLYQAHDDDAGTPLEETLAAFAELIAEGKVRAIGASNYTAPRLQEALATSARLGLPRYERLQPLYNLMDRAAYEADLEQLCRREGLGVINFYGLASGFLTGKYRSEAGLAKSARGARCKAYLTARGRRVLAALDAIAQTHGATPAQVALAWQIARPGLTAPIASATSTAQWAELAGAAQLQLAAADIQALNDASAARCPLAWLTHRTSADRPIAGPHDGLPAGAKRPGQGCDGFSTGQPLVQRLPLQGAQALGPAQRFTFRFRTRKPGLRALDQQVAFKLRHSGDHPHGHLASGAGEVHAAQGQAMHAHPQLRQGLHGHAHVHGVAPQPVELGHYQHIAGLQLVQQASKSLALGGGHRP